VSMVMNLQVSLNVENFLTSWGTISFSRILLHGVILKNTTLLIRKCMKSELTHGLCPK
jgi:hypothetical protein